MNVLRRCAAVAHRSCSRRRRVVSDQLLRLMLPRSTGATSVEYALMVSLIAVVIVVAVTLFGRNTNRLFDVPAHVFQP